MINDTNLTSFLCSKALFTILSDKLCIGILEAASIGLRSNSNSNPTANQSRKQYYVRLKRLVNIGLVEKIGSVYTITTFGSLVYENHLKTMEKVISNYWQIKTIDVLRTRNDFPPDQKENIINEYVATTNLTGTINPTQLTSYNVVKRFEQLIPEVMKVIDNAENEIYFATRYYDPHVSNMMFNKLGKGVSNTRT